MKVNSKCKICHSRKCVSMCRLRNSNQLSPINVWLRSASWDLARAHEKWYLIRCQSSRRCSRLVKKEKHVHEIWTQYRCWLVTGALACMCVLCNSESCHLLKLTFMFRTVYYYLFVQHDIKNYQMNYMRTFIMLDSMNMGMHLLLV